jgi:serine/threonine-protein kinase
MAEVYLAEQQSLGRRVAVKVLRSDLAEDPIYLERFRREARSAAALVHAGIVQIYEVAERDGVHLIAQEYVQGLNLRDWMRRHGSPSLPQTLSIMRQVAAALAKASDAGIVHRDIKPENIMITDEGEVKVADFGLARLSGGDAVELTQVGMTMGTPLYMSPEQVEGRPLDTRSDLYSFGVTCYHMLTGEPPHRGETALSVALKHLREQPEPLEHRRADLPPALCRVVDRMLAKDPDERYDHPRQLLAELRQIYTEHAEENWGDSLAEWDVSGSIAAGPSGAGSTGAEAMDADGLSSPTVRLSQIMRTQEVRDVRRRDTKRWQRWQYPVALIGALLLGGLIALPATRSGALLPPAIDFRSLDVPRHDTVRGQWFYAATRDTEAAWRAVIEYFPDQGEFTRRAKQRLAEIYLLDGHTRRAMTLFTQLADDPDADAATRAFGLAGRGVVFALEGQHDRSARELDELYPLQDQLREPRMKKLVRETIARNREVLGTGSDQKWDALMSEGSEP